MCCRYADIKTYSDTRVILKSRTKRESDVNSFIHASYVDSPFKKGDRRIIAAQGPLKNTIKDFWRMIS